MYAILGMIKVKPEHLEQFIEHVRVHAQRSVREPGCVRFDVLQDSADPHTICLYEVFRSEADLERHRAHDYYAQWREMSQGWRDHAVYSRRVLRFIHPSDTEWS